MLIVPPQIKVFAALAPTDMRNYAVTKIMRSTHRLWAVYWALNAFAAEVRDG
jgi:hypothetical protein